MEATIEQGRVQLITAAVHIRGQCHFGNSFATALNTTSDALKRWTILQTELAAVVVQLLLRECSITSLTSGLNTCELTLGINRFDRLCA